MPRALRVGLLLPGRFVTIANQPLHRGTTVTFPAEDVQQHRMRDLKTGRQLFRRGGNKAEVSVLVPIDEIFLRWLALHRLLAIAGGLLRELEIFNDMLRCLRDDPALVIKTFPPGAAADLVEIPRAQDERFLPVKLAQPREQHRADRNIDAHAERVRAAATS